jgi:hypothetical protein
MFKGQESISFTTDKPVEVVVNLVEEHLQSFGKVSVSRQGSVDIDPRSKYSTTFAETVFEGSLERNKKNPQQYSLTISFNAKPTIACWVVAVLGTTAVCIGFLVLLVPFNMKKNVQQELGRSLNRLKDELA